MLFILTGTPQTGKTRWLQALIERLQHENVPVYGVVAPGCWIDHGAAVDAAAADGRNGASYEGSPAAPFERYEKTGINNVFLPQGECVAFARRPDLAAVEAANEGSGDEESACVTCSQATQAKLGWAISDAAIDQVNAYFCSLCAQARDCALPEAIKKGAGITAQAPQRPGLLVIDELGPLELIRGGGLTSAMDVLSQGPSPLTSHALVVVRESLVDVARERFETCWDGVQEIYPTSNAAEEVLSMFLPREE